METVSCDPGDAVTGWADEGYGINSGPAVSGFLNTVPVIVDGQPNVSGHYVETDADGQEMLTPCPIHEEPLHLVPLNAREQFLATLNGKLEPERRIFLEGDLCPYCRRNFEELEHRVRELVTLDEANIRAWSAEHGVVGDTLAELLASPEVNELVRGIIDEKNRELASFETIKHFRLLEEFSIDNGLLTPTLKVKRNVAMERFADVIEEMYRED